MSDDDLIASTGKKKSLYKKREPVYIRMIAGNSHLYRNLTALVIYGAFFLLPWLSWGERPAIYFDLVARQFHIFSLNLWPQDFIYLAWFLIIAAFALFLFTNIAGRLWCGYACPQTIWTLLFMWVEEKVEGNHRQRKRLDEAPLSTRKVRLKLTKHIIWLLIAVVTGATFVSYFYPARELWQDMFSLEVSLVAAFWVALFTWLTYVDAAWLREQVCIYMCPYARFQSVMYDQDTLLVSYDTEKGEPRGPLKEPGHGQCIDCSLCVQVCPTGIDIRDGVQISCINCGLCVDACDDVMRSIGKPTDLIRFTTLNQLEGKPSKLLRPRTIGYSLVLLAMITLMASHLWQRSPLEASVIRDRDHIYRQLDENTIANDYWLNIANKAQNSESYRITIAEPGFSLRNAPYIELASGESQEHNLVISSHKAEPGSHTITLVFTTQSDNSEHGRIETRFIVPQR